MRILLLNVTYNQGSTGKIVHDLYTYLKKQGHKAVVCYGRGKKVDSPDIYKISSNVEVYVHALLTRVTGLVGYFSWFATRRLLRIIREFKPDVVHLHNLHGYYINILPVINYLKQNSIKCVWTLHDEYMYTGKCGHSYECESWKNQCGCCPCKRDYPRSLFFDFTKKMLNEKKMAFDNLEKLVIVTPSQWLLKRVNQSFLCNKRIVTIQNGIDTDIFRPYDALVLRKHYHLNDEEKIIMHATSSFENELKGGQYVLDLAERMHDVMFFIVGNRKQIKNLPNNVIALGRTETQRQLANYYCLADLLLITSKCENFPTVCIEALCCGTPVVGFAEGGTPETAPEGYGVFAPFGEMEALESAVRFALHGGIKNKVQCAEYGKYMYDKEKMAQKYFEVY